LFVNGDKGAYSPGVPELQKMLVGLNVMNEQTVTCNISSCLLSDSRALLPQGLVAMAPSRVFMLSMTMSGMSLARS